MLGAVRRSAACARAASSQPTMSPAEEPRDSPGLKRSAWALLVPRSSLGRRW